MVIISKAFSVFESVRTESAATMNAMSVPLIQSISQPSRAGERIASEGPAACGFGDDRCDRLKRVNAGNRDVAGIGMPGPVVKHRESLEPYN